MTTGDDARPQTDHGGTHVSTPHLDELDNLPALVSVPKAARMLGIARASAYRYAAAGELPTRRLGGRVYVVTQQLREFITGTDQGDAA